MILKHYKSENIFKIWGNVSTAALLVLSYKLCLETRGSEEPEALTLLKYMYYINVRRKTLKFDLKSDIKEP